jgi:hypothetical protein
MKFALITALIGLVTVIAWVIVASIEHKREMKQLTDDYLNPRNDSFINPNVETYNEIVEDLSKEEKYLNWLNDAKKNNN